MGYLRLFLALAVVSNHLNWQFAKFSGPLAVFGFYTISGFLIARVLLTTYRQRPVAFMINRALRLYPAYWIFVGAGLLIALYGTPLNKAMSVPVSFDEAWRQITLLGILHLYPLNTGSSVSLVPPAWSLNIEIASYILMLLTVHWINPWLLISGAIAAVFLFYGNYALAYSNYFGPSVCFAIGAAIYIYREKLPDADWRVAVALLATEMVAGNFVAGIWLLYGSALVAGYAILALDKPNVSRLPLQRSAGDLSYPVFLSHWAVASVVSSVTGLDKGWPLLITSLPLILGVSWAVVNLVEIPVQNVRNKIRKRTTERDSDTSSAVSAVTTHDQSRCT